MCMYVYAGVPSCDASPPHAALGQPCHRARFGFGRMGINLGFFVLWLLLRCGKETLAAKGEGSQAAPC